MPGILYFDDREILFPLQPNPNLALAWRSFNRILNEMSYDPFQPGGIRINRKTGILYFKNRLGFGNRFALYRFL